ncbi:peptidoglycan-binding protein [Streptomyces sp. NPDC004788]
MRTRTRARSLLSRAALTVALTGALLAPAAAFPSYAEPAPKATVVTAAGWPTLRQGSRGVDVATVQDLLAAAGHAVTADGRFGADTAGAVRAFQRAHRLPVDGVVGARTWTALTAGAPLRNGAKGRAVRALQRQLAQEGHRIALDGAFGAGTAAAVRAAQRAHGLPADGVAGPRTWSALVAGGGSTTPATPTTPAPGKPSALRQRIVNTARAQIGASEPNGCRTYLKDCAHTSWCAAFVEWTWRKSGVPAASVPKTLVAREVGLWGRRNGLFHRSNPKPGDIVVWGTPAAKTGGHVAIVVAVHADGRIDTVDGNYGDKVALRKNIDPRTAKTRKHLISGYVSPRGA